MASRIVNRVYNGFRFRNAARVGAFLKDSHRRQPGFTAFDTTKNALYPFRVSAFKRMSIHRLYPEKRAPGPAAKVRRAP